MVAKKKTAPTPEPQAEGKDIPDEEIVQAVQYVEKIANSLIKRLEESGDPASAEGVSVRGQLALTIVARRLMAAGVEFPHPQG